MRCYMRSLKSQNVDKQQFKIKTGGLERNDKIHHLWKLFRSLPTQQKVGFGDILHHY